MFKCTLSLGHSFFRFSVKKKTKQFSDVLYKMLISTNTRGRIVPFLLSPVHLHNK